MKRSTPEHPKFLALCRALKIPKYAAAGILEMLWHFAGRFAVAGDIGKYTDEAIAEAVGWDGVARNLVEQLCNCGWLDRCNCHRLYIHDWNDHADRTVKRVAVSRGQEILCVGHDAKQQLCHGSTMEPSGSSMEPSGSPAVILVPGTGYRVPEPKEEVTPSAEPGRVTWDNTGHGQFVIPDGKIDEWTEAYPSADVQREIAKAEQWYRDNPERRKKSHQRFLSNWLSHADQRTTENGDPGSLPLPPRRKPTDEDMRIALGLQ